MVAYVALGGIVGTLARYFVQAWLQGPSVHFPTGTLAINIIGSFVLGFVMRLATGSTLITPETRGALTIGFCGAFTTMSTFSYETVRLVTGSCNPEVPMPHRFEGERTLMRIFIGESDKYRGKPLYEALLETFHEKGMAGATVLRGVAGFGASSRMHTDKDPASVARPVAHRRAGRD